MKSFLILSVILMICFSGYSQEMTENDRKIVNKIKEENTRYTSILGTFKQTKHLSILGEDITSKGMLYYEKPDKMSMHYTIPEGDLMTIKGEDCVLVADGKKRKVSSKSNAKMRGLRNILAACFKGDVSEIHADKIACEERVDEYVITVRVDTRSNKSKITEVVAVYNKPDMTLSVLKTVEGDGSYNLYEWNDKKFNGVIDGDIFNVK